MAAPVAGLSSLPFQYSLCIDQSIEGSVNFWNSAGLQDVAFLDAAGNPISGVAYSFAGGTRLLGASGPPPALPAPAPGDISPEPGTFVLFGTGLAGTIRLLRRRRARA